MISVKLFTTLGCHLCEEAENVWQQWLAQNPSGQSDFELKLVEIAEDEKLMELYGIRIPVLKRADNEEELGWPFDLTDLEVFLQ